MSIILDFNYACDATEELASGIFARLEAYTVELETSERSGLLDVHKMRSVESLSSLSEPAEGSDIIPREEYSGRRNAIFVNPKKIIIPVDALIDSEASFEKASAKLTVSLYEERRDDSLRRFLEEPRMGAKLLRDLLEDETDSPLERANVTETLATVCHSIPLFRPLHAAIEYVRMTDDSALISVQLTCNEALREEYTIDSLSLVLGDLASHAINLKDGMFEKRIFQVEPFSVPLPASLKPGEVYGCIFQATRMPFAERLLRGKPQEMKVHLDATMAATWHDRWATRSAQNEKLLVSFESEVNMSRMFPNRHNGELAITLTRN
ncbi:hypothetical protein PSACC_00340 [Paramicrosporidium saccamoebae]|uniref:Uncharacterized protein n=1 Tax=Paramicrosporidium saccamoebae TaxID=1246581 RepID=A0A2H9TQ02_9FUNG|nr:hypothetical protein PSACC_00340 [Paramicrosporidium saccamoebae]